MTMTIDAQPTLLAQTLTALQAIDAYDPEDCKSGLADTVEADCPVCDQASLLVTHDQGEENAVYLFCQSDYGAGCALEAIYTALNIPRPGDAYMDGISNDPLDTRPIAEVLRTMPKEELMKAEQRADAILRPLRDHLGPDEQHENAIRDELDRLKVREEARERHEAEKAAKYEQPKLVPMRAFMDEPDDETQYLIDQLLTKGGNALVTAANKTGKSTLMGDLLRSLADGEPFLGTYAVEPRNVVIIDNELDPRTMRRWLRDKGIQNMDRVRLLSLRGRTASFQITDPTIRAAWAAELADTDVLIFDCFRPLLDALGKDENSEAGQVLVSLDALKLEAGIGELILVHHMGHGAERARGDSRILDWPDAIWKMIRSEKEDPSSPRYFSAFGRDVDVAESRLLFDPATRRLSLEGGSRKDAARDDALMDVLAFLRTIDPAEGVSTKALEEALLASTSHGRAAIRAALKLGKDRSLIMTHAGPRGAYIHRLNPMTSPARHSSPPARQQGQNDLASAPIGRGEEVVRNDDLATDKTGEVKCAVCKQPLHPIHANNGYTNCPSCDPGTGRQDTP